MSSTGSLFSQTLQEITNTKLDELSKKRGAFEERRQALITAAQKQDDDILALESLASEVKKLFSIATEDGRVIRGRTDHLRLEIDLKNLDRFLAQAKYDPSVSPKVLGQWQDSLLRHLNIRSLKFAYASLYGQLTTEWLSSKQPAPSIPTEDETVEDFEHVSGGKKMESRLKWEQSVFEPKEVDLIAVTTLLKDLFEAKPEDSKHILRAIKALRERVAEFERELAGPSSFTTSTLCWTIQGLENSDLLTDDKRAVLKDFKGNQVILNEVADVLNMRIAALDRWTWGEEVRLEQRRQLNGSFNMYMHEDLLQAIFLQHIGVKWSVFWKRTLSQFRNSKGVWKSPGTSVPLIDRKRREYYLGTRDSNPSVESEKQKIYRRSYFVSQLLKYENQHVGGAEGEEEANFEESYQQPAQSGGRARQTARQSAVQAQQAARIPWANQPQNTTGGLVKGGRLRHRRIQPEAERECAGEEDEFEQEDNDDDYDESLSPMLAKQTLLHLLSTDISIKCRLHGEITCFRSQVDSLYPSLPHATIESVLKFFGVSQSWLQFFTRFLQAPLRFMDDKAAEPRLRKRGTPGAHVLSEVFGEVVLFCLDFAINQDTDGQALWRLNDDLWFWSADNKVCAKAWSRITKFTETMGLSLNEARTGGSRMLQKAKDAEKLVSANPGHGLPEGQIRWGMLLLNAESGRFEIDQEMVDKHIEELIHQLKGKKGSIFAWIQTYNTYAARFFTSNFGKPANCFGRQHVDDMLATHERIQRRIFASSAMTDANQKTGSVVEFLKLAIEQRFGVKDIPDGYFFFPTQLGGLDVLSPFIGLLQIRDAVTERPRKLLDDFEEAEIEAYKVAKKRFEEGKTREQHPMHDAPTFRPRDPGTFFSFEEFSKYREELWYGFDSELVDVFQKMLEQPSEESVEADENGTVKVAHNALAGYRGDLSGMGILSSWYSMEPYWKYVALLYGPEMIDRFGGFSIVEPGLLPMGMVSLFKSGRVSWQD